MSGIQPSAVPNVGETMSLAALDDIAAEVARIEKREASVGDPPNLKDALLVFSDMANEANSHHGDRKSIVHALAWGFIALARCEGTAP